MENIQLDEEHLIKEVGSGFCPGCEIVEELSYAHIASKNIDTIYFRDLKERYFGSMDHLELSLDDDSTRFVPCFHSSSSSSVQHNLKHNIQTNDSLHTNTTVCV